MARIFRVDGRDFLSVRQQLSNWVFSEGDIIFFKNEGNFIPLGVSFVSGLGDELQIIREYFQATFCQDLRNVFEAYSGGLARIDPYPWHIRLLYGKPRCEDGMETSSLCGKLPAGLGRDLVAPVSFQQSNICEECAWEWWNLLASGAF